MGPYDIIERIGLVACRLALPMTLFNLHDVFHISQLRKHEPNPTQVMPEDTIEVQGDLTYPEMLVQILDLKEQVLKNKMISSVQVLWRNLITEEITWE